MNVVSLEPVPNTAPNAPPSPLPDRSLPWFSATEPMDLDDAYFRLSRWRQFGGIHRELNGVSLNAAKVGTADGRNIAIVMDGGADVRLPLRETAFKQLCTRVGAPPHYVRELPAHLQRGCLDHGLSRNSQSATLRIAGGTVRAIVSARYAPLDDPELFELLDEALIHTGYRSDVRVRGFAAGKRTVLRITLPADGETVRPGDVVEYGIDVVNSELGIAAIQVTPVTYRLVCTNGMRSWSKDTGVRVAHRGNVQRVRETFCEAIPVAFARARGDVALFRKAAEHVVQAVLQEVDGLSRLGLSATEIGSVATQLVDREELNPRNAPPAEVRRLLERRSSTVFDVANAITAMARSKPVGRRLELESAGYRYLQAKAA